MVKFLGVTGVVLGEGLGELTTEVQERFIFDLAIVYFSSDSVLLITETHVDTGSDEAHAFVVLDEDDLTVCTGVDLGVDLGVDFGVDLIFKRLQKL